MTSNPIISVILPVYNGGKYLKESIESILNQTFRNFELIIINDGSTDSTDEIIDYYSRIDSRIIKFKNKNMGLVKSLNLGIELSKGEYIARMDADDISLPSRLQLQYDFMIDNNLDICGSNIYVLNGIHYSKGCYYQDHNDLKFLLMFESVFAHPAVIIKKSIFDHLKYLNYMYIEDYKLWIDISLNNYKMSNVSDFLLIYRVHENQVSNIHKNIQLKNSVKVSLEYVGMINEYNIHENLINFYNDLNKKNYEIVLKSLVEYCENKNVSMDALSRASLLLLKNTENFNLSYIVVYLRVIGCDSLSGFDKFKLIAYTFVRTVVGGRFNNIILYYIYGVIKFMPPYYFKKNR